MSKVLVALLSQVTIGVMGIVAYRMIAATSGYQVAGLIFFAISFNGVIRAVFDFGVSRTVIREMAILKQPSHHQALINHYLMLYVLAALFFFLGFATWVLTIFPNWFEKRFDSLALNWPIALFFAGGGVAILTSYMQSLMIGAKRINLVNQFEAASALVLFGMLMAAVLAEVTLSQIAIAFFIVFFLKMCFQLYLTRRTLGTGIMWPKLERRIYLKTYNNLRFNILISISLLLHKQLDKITAAILLPIELVGYYTIILMSLSRVSLLTQSIAAVIFPEFSSKTGLTKEDMHRFSVITMLNIIVMGPLYVVLFLLSSETGQLLIGNVAPDQAAIVSLTIKVMSVYFGLNMVFRLYRTLISSSRFVSRLALSDAIGLGISLPLVVVLCVTQDLVGLAVGMCAFFLVSGPLTVSAAYRYLLTEQRIAGFLRLVVGVALLSGVIFGSLTLLGSADERSLLELGVNYFFGYLVYLGVALIVFPPLREVGPMIRTRLKI